MQLYHSSTRQKADWYKYVLDLKSYKQASEEPYNIWEKLQQYL